MRKGSTIYLLVLLLGFIPGARAQQGATVEYVGNADLDGDSEVNAGDLLLLQEQWKTDAGVSFDAVLPQNRNLPNSLHANPRGMDYFYSRADGFGLSKN